MIRSFVDVVRAGALAGLMVAGWCEAQAVDVSMYYVRKGLQFTQTSSAAPTANQFLPALFIARVDGRVASIQEISLASPSPIFSLVNLDQAGDHFEFVIPGDTNEVNQFFPNGDYTF